MPRLWLVTKVSRFRRVSGSKESPNGLAPPVRSSPRSPASVPPPSLDNTHTKLFGKCFFQIIPLVMQHTLLFGTNFVLPNSQFFSYPGSSRPKTTYCSSTLSSCCGDYPRCFFQHPVPDTRHPWYLVTQPTVSVLRFFQHPVQDPGHPH